MIRQSSSASTRRVSTLVPPMRKVAKVVMRVATWNMGPELRYTVSSVMRWSMATIRSWARIARWASWAPLGTPPKAPV